MLLLGSHIPTVGGLVRAIERGLEIGCSVIQIFVKNNLRWHHHTSLSEVEIDNFRFKSQQLQRVIVHAGYLINLATSHAENRKKSIDSLSEEMERCHLLDIKSLVIHPGSYLSFSRDLGIKNIADNINIIHKKYPNHKTRITLENTAGQGTSIGSSFDDLYDIMALIEQPGRIDFCLDTAHLFAAGIPFQSIQDAEKTFQLFDRRIGLNRVSVIHLNNSKTPFNSHIDRHAHIRCGEIKLEIFKYIIQHKAFMNIPKILETPKDKNLTEDRSAIVLLSQFYHEK